MNNLFLGVIRNKNTTARSDNPTLDEDNEAYKVSRASFLTKKQSDLTINNTLTCECCSLPLINCLHIHHIDGDHTKNEHSNFSLRCPFCHYVEHIGFVGAKKMGSIVYAPNLSQERLNLLQVTAYSINSAISEMEKTSKNYSDMRNVIQRANIVLDGIKRTKVTVQRNFQSNDPMHFANIFLSMSDEEYLHRNVGAFSGLRIIYEPSFFEKEIKLWQQDIFQLKDSNQGSQMHPLSWVASAKMFRNQIKKK